MNTIDINEDGNVGIGRVSDDVKMTTIRNIYKLVDRDTSELTVYQLEDIIDSIQNEIEFEYSLEELETSNEIQ